MADAITLRRIDPERNMTRFYRVDVQPTLFGTWSVVREWGRIGRGGTVRIDGYQTSEGAADARASLIGKKQRRGYCPEEVTRLRTGVPD